MSEPIPPSGPNLREGVALKDIPDGGCLVGQADGEAILFVREGEDVFAVGAACGHYGAPLADGIVVGHEIRCPWHHACFDVRAGAVVGPPSPRAIAAWEVLRDGARVKLGAKKSPPVPKALQTATKKIVIIGAGAAGDECAAELRTLGFAGDITVLARDDESWPVDRPNLSKDFLAGTAPEDWLPVRGADFYKEKNITVRMGATATKIDRAAKKVILQDGSALPYDKLLIATGAAAIRLDIPGKERAFLMRTLADSRAVVARIASAKTAVVIGASFIGLEVAASLRARGLEVHVVAPETLPLQRVLGPELGAFVQALHEEHGVVFHLGRKPATITESAVTLDDGANIAAELVVMGVGVRPVTDLAEAAGLKIDRGVVVDEFLRTADADIFAAGDIARYPAGGASWRVEHWVAAQRQGQIAARNMVGRKEPMRAVPFFWSQHYDVPINYVGHAEVWDKIEVAGSIKDRNALVAYWQGGRIIASATIYRDKECLLAGEALAQNDQAALVKLLA